MKRSVLVLALVVVSGVARAEPMTTVKLTDHELHEGLGTLAAQFDEPIGLRADADLPKLGLVRGDIVVAVDGRSSLGMSLGMWGGQQPVRYLDVKRGKRDLVVRVEVQLGAIEQHAERDDFERTVTGEREFSDVAFSPVTHAGHPSGVLVRMPMSMALALDEGDLVRRVDGKAVTTAAELLDALEAAKADAKIQLDLERLGRPVQVTIVLDDPPKEDSDLAAAIAKIKQVDATTYDVPKTVIDLVLQNPMSVMKTVRIVPAIKNGKPAGFKLYAIRPSSLFAVLGLANGDTIEAINGETLDSLDKALDAYTKLSGAKSVKVDLERRGKAMTLEYRIK